MERLVTDELWAVVAPLLPKHRAHRKGGRPWTDDRAVLTGILFVLRSGLPWRMLPQEMGCGSGVTCWRRLRAWQQRGVWHRLHRVMLAELALADHIDWERAVLDSRSLAAKKGEPRPGATRPTGAARARSTISSSTRRASRSPAR